MQERLAQDSGEPNAILRAAHIMKEAGQDWHEAVVLASPDTPFQFDRAFARALNIHIPEMTIVAEDKRSMVVHIGPSANNGFFFGGLKEQVEQTTEGQIAVALSNAYRFSFAPLKFIARDFISDIELQINKLAKKEKTVSEQVRFGMFAVRRFWDDMADQVGNDKVRMYRDISVISYGQRALSYEGYLATLLMVIRS